MWTVIEYASFFFIVYWLVKHAWPSRVDQEREEDRKHAEVLEAVAKLERQKAPPPPPPPQPTSNSAERARVLALGKIRDGGKRHPILDTPWVSVANPQKK